MNGVIAKMLMDPREHVKQLTKVRLQRPGEFLVELGDRIYGTAALRLVGLGIEDAARAGDVQAPGQPISQSGILFSSAVTTPTAKHFKATMARKPFFDQAPPEEEDLIPRNSLYGRWYATSGPFKPFVPLNIPGRDKPLLVDLTKTDAWAKHVNSFAYRVNHRLFATLTNIAKNSGEIIATPVALHTASNRNRTVKELRAEIARTLQADTTAQGQAEPQVDNEAMAMRQRVIAQLEKNAADADEVVNTVRQKIKEVVQFAGYEMGLVKVDLDFLSSTAGAAPVSAGEDSQGPALGIIIPGQSTVEASQVGHGLPPVQEESGASADARRATRSNTSTSRPHSMVERGFEAFQSAARALFPIGESPEHSDDAQTPRDVHMQEASSPTRLEPRQEPINTPLFAEGQVEALLDQISREADAYVRGRTPSLLAPGNVGA